MYLCSAACPPHKPCHASNGCTRAAPTLPRPLAITATASFATLAYHAYQALPAASHSASTLHTLLNTQPGWAVLGYGLAGMLAVSIVPFTMFVIAPTTNNKLFALNRTHGAPYPAARSQPSSATGTVSGGKAGDDGSRLVEGSWVQGKAVSGVEEARVKELLTQFGMFNAVRGFLIGGAGVVGMCVALSGW